MYKMPACVKLKLPSTLTFPPQKKKKTLPVLSFWSPRPWTLGHFNGPLPKLQSVLLLLVLVLLSIKASENLPCPDEARGLSLMGTVHAREPVAAPPMSPAEEEAGPSGDATVSLSGIGAQVTKIHIDGVERTHEDLVLRKINPVFKVRHFEELVLKAHEARSDLQDLGCFSDVSIHIDTAEEGGPKDYEVTFKVTELRRVIGSINTMLGNQEGSLFTGLKCPNLQGRGEQFQVDYTYGSKKTNAFNVRYMKPFHDDNKTILSSSIFQQIAEFPPSGFKELNRGGLLDLSFISAPNINHNLQYEACWRELRPLTKSCAFAVREQVGHSLKSALRHILTVDRRDNPVFPVEGSLFRLTQEYAGLGGDVGFFKNEVWLEANTPIFGPDFVLQGTLNCGLMKALSDGKRITLADNFYLGGPLNVRGFEMRGLGNESDGNYLGSDMFWSSGLHLFAPLPFRPGRGGFGDLFRTHLFVTAGNLCQFNGNNHIGDGHRFMENALRNFRLSYGLGVAFRLGGIGRLELNYCIPVRCERGDKPAPGLQFGVGVNFL